MFDKYTPKPYHLFYTVIFLAIGTSSFMFAGWEVFGVTVYLIGVGSGIWVVVGGMYQKVTEYWEQIEHTASQLEKIKNPDVWRAFGFAPPEPTITIERHTSYGQGFVNTEYAQLPISDAKLYKLASGIRREKLPLSQAQWSGKKYGKLLSNPAFRELIYKMEEQKLVKPIDPEHRNRGFGLTKKGAEYLDEFLDNYSPRMEDRGTPPALLDEYAEDLQG